MAAPAGKRNRKIRFEQSSITRTGRGIEKPGGWAKLEDAWASVSFGTSQERRQSQGEGASQMVTFRVLSTAALRTVTPGDQFRIVWTGIWNIVGRADVGGEASEIEFTATTLKA